MRARVIRTEREWLTLEPAWDRLLQRSSSDSFFLTWAWLRTWWETWGQDYELLVLIAEDRDELCGIAPFAVTHTGQLEYMGTNAAWGEYLDVIALTGSEEAVTRLLIERLLDLADESEPVWRTAFLRFVRRDAVCSPYLREAFAERGRSLTEVESDVSPYVLLPSAWSRYLEGHSGNFRNWISRNENRLARLGRSRLLFGGADMPRAEAFRIMMDLHADRWEKPFEPRFAEFHLRLSERLHALGWLVLVILEVGGQPVAAKYDFAYAGKIWCYQGGWRRDLAALRPGNVLLARLLQWGITNGFGEYDFLAGDAQYKRRWSNASRETVNLAT